jgi:[phosphatase 2A protein]-leucine-carboxy methyltransferase
MSAPQIPNLSTFRRGAGRDRGRGRGTASSAAEESHGSHPVKKDKIIQNTDHDAATSRLSAADAGYLDDSFSKLFTHGGVIDRRLPLMNRGLSSPKELHADAE